MAAPETISKQVKVIGFDVYETLLPFQPKFVPAFEDLLKDNNSELTPEQLLEGWKKNLFYHMNVNTIVNAPRSSIFEVGQRALKAYLNEAGIEYTENEIIEVVESWEELEPHPEVVENFERLGEEYILVGFSNGDPDLLEAVRPTFEGTLDGMMSSALAGEFKPDPDTYKLLIDEYNVAAHEVLYVAAHDFDIIGPHHVGIRTCFVERYDPYGDWDIQPDLWVQNIREMTDILLEDI